MFFASPWFCTQRIVIFAFFDSFKAESCEILWSRRKQQIVVLYVVFAFIRGLHSQEQTLKKFLILSFESEIADVYRSICA